MSRNIFRQIIALVVKAQEWVVLQPKDIKELNLALVIAVSQVLKVVKCPSNVVCLSLVSKTITV